MYDRTNGEFGKSLFDGNTGGGFARTADKNKFAVMTLQTGNAKSVVLFTSDNTKVAVSGSSLTPSDFLPYTAKPFDEIPSNFGISYINTLEAPFPADNYILLGRASGFVRVFEGEYNYKRFRIEQPSAFAFNLYIDDPADAANFHFYNKQNKMMYFRYDGAHPFYWKFAYDSTSNGQQRLALETVADPGSEIQPALTDYYRNR